MTLTALAAAAAGAPPAATPAGLTVRDGFIVDPRVTDRRIAELEHGAMTKVDAIVLHQTDSSTLNLDHARADGIGAHFYIDKDGSIVQTARLDQSVYSVGKIRSKCDDAHTCAPAEQAAIDAIMQSKAGYGSKVKQLNAHEQAKAYPDRYPANGDSIAIEVVAKFDPKTQRFERPTAAQTESLKWLTQALAQQYGLDLNADVYRHSDISYKQADEAQGLVYQ